MREYPSVSIKDKYFYVDQEGNDFAVVGDDSGHVYGLHVTFNQAQTHADKLNYYRNQRLDKPKI